MKNELDYGLQKELPQEVIKDKIPGYLYELNDKLLLIPRVPLFFRIVRVEYAEDINASFPLKGWNYLGQTQERIGYAEFSLTRFPQAGMGSQITSEGIKLIYIRNSSLTSLTDTISYHKRSLDKNDKNDNINTQNTSFTFGKIREFIDSLPQT